MMNRWLLAALVLSPALAAADPGGPCKVDPADPSERAMKLQLAAGSDDFPHHILAPDGTSAFPAISKDGKTLVQLFKDTQDFTGAPVTTLVFFSKAGKRLASFRLGGMGTKGAPKDEAPAKAWDAYEAKALTGANKKLAATTWVPLPRHTPCNGYEDRTSTLEFVDATLQLDLATQKLSTHPGDAHSKTAAKAVKASFPDPGVRSEPGMKGGCGEITGLDSGFGSAALGVAIVVPRANLGGDSCSGKLNADMATAIPLK
jgi:hypothetical protein